MNADKYTKALANLAEAQSALKAEQAKPEAVELMKANSALTEADALGPVMAKMPGGPSLHASLVSAAKQAVVNATAAMSDSYTIVLAKAELATQEAEVALDELVTEAINSKDEESLRDLVTLGLKAQFGGARRTSTGSNSAGAELPHSITVAGKLFVPEITPTGRQSWPGLKSAMISAGVPADAWTKSGNTTNVRVAAAHSAICTLHF